MKAIESPHHIRDHRLAAESWWCRPCRREGRIRAATTVVTLGGLPTNVADSATVPCCLTCADLYGIHLGKAPATMRTAA